MAGALLVWPTLSHLDAVAAMAPVVRASAASQASPAPRRQVTTRELVALYGGGLLAGDPYSGAGSQDSGSSQGGCAAVQRDVGTFGAPFLVASYSTDEAQRTDMTSAAQDDAGSRVARYTAVASSAAGTLGVFLRTVENMEPAPKATSGDFTRQVAALDAAYDSMIRAAKKPGEATSIEQQGLAAIQKANAAINAQGKTGEYADNLRSTGAGERQWGTGINQPQIGDQAAAGGDPERRVVLTSEGLTTVHCQCLRLRSDCSTQTVICR